MAGDPHALGAVELGAAYRAGALSPVEVTEAVLERIAAWEPAINAMYRVDAEGALIAARAAEGRWRRGEAFGPLDGVPITIKDNIATEGTPVPVGTAAGDLTTPAAADAPPAARAREAGCVLIGKTTMPDYGMLSSGLSGLHGVTRNPWDTTRNTFGSSSGAGAGVAAGYGPLAIGTDIGGSVRLPAAACGVVGHKPSLGRVPIDPPYWGRCAGPMTRTVIDSALLLTALALPDARDHMSLPYEAVNYANLLEGEVAGLRIGLMLDSGPGLPVDAEVRAAVERAAGAFEDAGAVVEPLPPFLTPAMMAGLDVFFRARAYADLVKLPPERREKILPFIRVWGESARDLSAVELFDAFNTIPLIRAATVRATGLFDYVLSPTSPIVAYAAEDACPGNDPARPFEHIVFTAAFNQSEQPACSVPCGVTGSGLPIGLQITGRRFDDLGVLRLAHAYERMRPEMPAWPEPPAA